MFFGLIADASLYFKVDDTNRTDYVQRGCKPFQPFADKPELSTSCYDVPADLLDDVEELSRWARKSLSVALVAANSRTKRVAKNSVRKSRAKRAASAKSKAKRTTRRW